MPLSSEISPLPLPVLAYDIGGSHIAAAICLYTPATQANPAAYALLGLARAPLPADAPEGAGHFSAASFVRLLATLGHAAANSANIDFTTVVGASFAFPGPFDFANGVSHMQHKLQGLYGFHLKSALATRFQWQPHQLNFLKDADAFLLGEIAAGAALAADRAIGITLGTGIGCAFGLHGLITTSAPGVPPDGEIWNLPYNGATVEDFVSTRFLRQHYQTLTGLEAEVATIADTAKDPAACREVNQFEAHCRARQAFQDFGNHLGLALNQIAAEFNPEVIVLGGGISRAASLFLPATRAALTDFHPRIAVSTLLDQAPLVGAAHHFFQHFFSAPDKSGQTPERA